MTDLAQDPLDAIGIVVQENVDFEMRRKMLLMNGVQTAFALLAAGNGHPETHEFAKSRRGGIILGGLAEEYSIAFFAELAGHGHSPYIDFTALREYAVQTTLRIRENEDSTWRIIRMDAVNQIDWLGRTFLTIHERVALPLQAYCRMQRTDDWRRPFMGQAILCLRAIVERMA